MTKPVATLEIPDPTATCFEHVRDPETGEELPAKAAQVMEAGSKLFTEHGFGAVSMDQVAKTAGVSKATVYAHFQSKEQLFVAIVRRSSTPTRVSAATFARGTGRKAWP